MIRNRTIAFLLLLSVQQAYAQGVNPGSPVSSCGTDRRYEMARKDSAFIRQENQLNQLIRQATLRRQSIQTTSNGVAVQGIQNTPTPDFPNIYQLPVVFHIVSENPDAITDAMVLSALNGLNDAFAHRGAFSSDPLGVHTGIQFCLASIAPDGGNTTGINRIKSYLEGFDMDLETNRLMQVSDWDHQQYINIWVVGSIRAENPVTYFECGKWTRIGVGGFASPGMGLVVAGLGTALIAHEMGHYLSLYHTFEGQSCINNDCTTDGDRVCDTPPDRSINSSPCNSPENSCRTDTVSGFTLDVPDIISNFMDYGSPCPSVFTLGQAQRMRAFVEVYAGGSLLSSNKCDAPCAGAPQANFEYRSQPYPKQGELINFNNLTPGNDPFEWVIDGVLAGTTKNFSYTFPTAGIYDLTLRAYNPTKICYSSYTAKVNVNCGVETRFSPDKRKVSHSGSIYTEPVTFTNYSFGATSFQWYVSDNSGNNYQPIATSNDLVYSFPSPGFYRIRLVGTNGACIDEAPVYSVNVIDARPDAGLFLLAVNCYKEDSIRVVFALNNNGYDSIPAGSKVKFYNKIPGQPGGALMSPEFTLPFDLVGKCGNTFTHILKANSVRQDTIMAIFDEDTLINELNETNNVSYRIFYQPSLSIQPADTIVNINSVLPVKARNRSNDPLVQINWTPAAQMSCGSCLTPDVTVNDTMLVKLRIKTLYDCIDSISAYVKVFPIDMVMKPSVANCYAKDTMIVTTDVCLLNGYTQLKRAVQIQYYDNDSTGGVGKLIGTGWIPVSTVFTGGCATIQHLLPQSPTGKVFGYLNPLQTVFEPNVSNNAQVTQFTPFTINLSTQQINLLRNEKVQLNIINQGDAFKSILWSPSGGLSCADCPNPVLNTLTNRNYLVTGVNQFYCSDTATLAVNVYFQNHLAMPNTFTPNGDGKNDIFYVISGETVSRVNQFQIFSRWGEKVFEIANVLPNDYSGGWDGNFRGKPAPAGTYVYVLILGLTDGTTETHRGNITLLR
jgi:gliding motility-associated-like protein